MWGNFKNLFQINKSTGLLTMADSPEQTNDHLTSMVTLANGTQAQWDSTTAIIPQGVPCYESDTGRIKVADGVRRYKDLPHLPLMLWDPSILTQQPMDFNTAIKHAMNGMLVRRLSWSNHIFITKSNEFMSQFAKVMVVNIHSKQAGGMVSYHAEDVEATDWVFHIEVKEEVVHDFKWALTQLDEGKKIIRQSYIQTAAKAHIELIKAIEEYNVMVNAPGIICLDKISELHTGFFPHLMYVHENYVSSWRPYYEELSATDYMIMPDEDEQPTLMIQPAVSING